MNFSNGNNYNINNNNYHDAFKSFICNLPSYYTLYEKYKNTPLNISDDKILEIVHLMLQNPKDEQMLNLFCIHHKQANPKNYIGYDDVLRSIIYDYMNSKK